MRTCSKDACASVINARGLCSKHYHHWRNSQSPSCAVTGCMKTAYVGGHCPMHYERVRKDGAPGVPWAFRRQAGTGSVNMYGYKMVNRPGHPLGSLRAQNKIEEHRVVLYDAIGPGPHGCHWCPKVLPWRGRPSQRICVDHLDFDRLNNDRANLVVSCLDCNTKRREKRAAVAA